MSILDAAIMVGTESTYGTPVAPTRAFEGKADAFEREQSRLESTGFRAGMQTARSDRHKTINMGGAGSLEIDVLSKGMGMLLAGALGSSAGPTQQASSDAYLQTFETTADAPADSYTIQVLRPKLETGTQVFTHHGCKIVSWNLKQSNAGLLVATFDFDSEDVDTSTGAATPAYPADSFPFDWSECTITLDPDGTPETLDATDFSFAANLALKTDRRYLRGSELKKEPVRSGIPTYTGDIAIDFSGTDRYDEWVAQSEIDVEVKWNGGTLDGAYDYEFALRMPVCNWTNGNPKVSTSDTPMQSLSFQALHNGTDPAVTVTYQSTDTAI